MSERKMGPREQQLREMREAKASQMVKAKAKVIGKVKSVKVMKRGRSGR